MENIKVFVADIDGTLRGRINRIPGQKTLQALEELHRRGVKVGVASGRPLWQEVTSHAEDWGLSFQFDFLIGMNGGELLDSHTGEKNIYYPLTEESLKEIVTKMEPLGLNPFIYKNGYQLAMRSDEHTEQSARRHHNRCEVAEDISDFWKEPTAKILYRVDTHEEAVQLEKYGRKLCNDHITCFLTGPELLEFQNPKINKGIAVQKYCEANGFREEEVIAFGDAQNDIEMLQAAGVAVCLKNGMEEVKSISDAVTEFDSDHDGVGQYLQEYVLVSNVN